MTDTKPEGRWLIVLPMLTVLAIWFVVIVISSVFEVRRAQAQERLAFQTRTWQLTRVVYGSDDAMRVDVIETEGACLYVSVVGPHPAYRRVAMAAVPKTQLPKGVGCQ